MVARNQVNVEVKHVATLDNLDIVAVVLELIPPTEVGIAVIVVISLGDCILYWTGDIWDRFVNNRAPSELAWRFTDPFRGHPRRLIHMPLHGQALSEVYFQQAVMIQRRRGYSPSEEADPLQRRVHGRPV